MEELEELNITETTENMTEKYLNDCSGCLNDLCIDENGYKEYLSYVTVDSYEWALISLNILVFLAGIMGNLLVSFIYLALFQQRNIFAVCQLLTDDADILP